MLTCEWIRYEHKHRLHAAKLQCLSAATLDDFGERDITIARAGLRVQPRRIESESHKQRNGGEQRRGNREPLYWSSSGP